MRVNMKKSIVLFLAVLMLGTAACGTKTDHKPQEGGVTAQLTPTDTPNQGGSVTEIPAQPTEQPEQPKESELKKLAYGAITTGQTTIKTKHLELHIPANVYITDDLVENIDILTSAMETVSGMKFAGNPKYSTERLSVEVEKLTDTESEMGPAYAYPGGVVISSGDLVDLFALTHETSHALQYNQSRWSYCTWAMEGVSTYTTYKVQEYIEQNHPELVTIVGDVNQSFLNYSIDDYDELYKYSMEYWADHTFEYAANVNYTIGFRFMWYLDEVYGDYTKWISEYEKANPYYSTTGLNDMLATEEQMKAFRMAYGEDVFDGFYTWVENNRERFEMGHIVDLSQAEEIRVYPMCAAGEIWYTLSSEYQYKDLLVRIDEGREYLSEYKGKDTRDMVLDVGTDVVLELYDAEGNFLRTEGPTQYNHLIALDGVGSVKLVGEGRLKQFSITGFENYE